MNKYSGTTDKPEMKTFDVQYFSNIQVVDGKRNRILLYPSFTTPNLHKRVSANYATSKTIFIEKNSTVHRIAFCKSKTRNASKVSSEFTERDVRPVSLKTVLKYSFKNNEFLARMIYIPRGASFRSEYQNLDFPVSGNCLFNRWTTCSSNINTPYHEIFISFIFCTLSAGSCGQLP